MTMQELIERLDIDAIEARAKKASNGVWVAKKIRYGAWAIDTELNCINGLSALFGVAVCHAVDDQERMMTEGGKHDSGDDAVFIAHARQDIPALIAHIRVLRARLALASDGEKQ